MVPANQLLDEREVHGARIRRLRWYGAWASLVAVACLGLLVWQHVEPAAMSSERRTRVVAERAFVIEQATTLDGVTFLLTRAIAFSEHIQLHLFTLNPGDTPRPAGVGLDDGDGGEIEVVPAGETVKARTIEHRVIELGDEFSGSPSDVHVRVRLEARDL